MLTRLRIELKPETKGRLNQNISSLLHGVLFDTIRPDAAEEMHLQGLKPYSQFVEIRGERLFWNIHTMTEHAHRELAMPMMEHERIHLRHKDLELVFHKKSMSQTSMKNLLEEHYFKEGSRFIQVRFTSPTAFKSQGNYVFMPGLRHIYQSLMNKYDACSFEGTVGSEEVLEHLSDHSIVTRYQLRSVLFHVEGIRIPAFLGTMTIKVNGPQALVNLAQLLFHFGEYSGVGIKSTLGMGGIRIIKRLEEERGM